MSVNWKQYALDRYRFRAANDANAAAPKWIAFVFIFPPVRSEKLSSRVKTITESVRRCVGFHRVGRKDVIRTDTIF